jgi:hypothetical protein
MPVSAYVQSAVFLILAAVALFASAGTIAIASFWLFLAILTAATAISLAILDPDLIRERMRPGGRRPPLALRLVGLIPLMQLIVAGLDRGRLHWSDSVPPWLEAAGLIAMACGLCLFLWAMAVNRFFSSIARIQAERGQPRQVLIAGCATRDIPAQPSSSSAAASRSALGSQPSSWSLSVCRCFSTGPPPKTGCSVPSFPATATTPTAYVGAYFQAFGETEQGLRSVCEIRVSRFDSHKTYYGTFHSTG